MPMMSLTKAPDGATLCRIQNINSTRKSMEALAFLPIFYLMVLSKIISFVHKNIVQGSLLDLNFQDHLYLPAHSQNSNKDKKDSFIYAMKLEYFMKGFKKQQQECDLNYNAISMVTKIGDCHQLITGTEFLRQTGRC